MLGIQILDLMHVLNEFNVQLNSIELHIHVDDKTSIYDKNHCHFER